MKLLLGILIGLGVGELMYLLDFLSGGSSPKIVQYIYGVLVIMPARLVFPPKVDVMNWNAVLVLYYGFNGLIAGAIAQSRIGASLLRFACFFGFFALQIILAFLFL